jgi:hypothetical protein
MIAETKDAYRWIRGGGTSLRGDRSVETVDGDDSTRIGSLPVPNGGKVVH